MAGGPIPGATPPLAEAGSIPDPVEGSRTRRKTLLLAALGAIALPALVPASSAGLHSEPCPGAGLRPTTSDLPRIGSAALCLLNRVRRAAHLTALRPNPDLAALATMQVTTMLAEDYFADGGAASRSATARRAVAHYEAGAAGGSAIGESLAWGTGSQAAPQQILAAWLASPAHRAVILGSEYRDVGLAVVARVPALLDGGGIGATYAIELGVRHLTASEAPTQPGGTATRGGRRAPPTGASGEGVGSRGGGGRQRAHGRAEAPAGAPEPRGGRDDPAVNAEGPVVRVRSGR